MQTHCAMADLSTSSFFVTSCPSACTGFLYSCSFEPLLLPAVAGTNLRVWWGAGVCMTQLVKAALARRNQPRSPFSFCSASTAY